jgi:putative Ca2+/H+ antiporter (TMEM165/GDT1 family)
MDLSVILTAFIVVFPAELPDKTMVASIVLSTRYHHPAAVWAGATVAFACQVAIAVFFGKLLTALPQRPVELVVATLFAVGAVVLWREGGRVETVDDDEADTTSTSIGPVPVAWRSFVVVFLAEWGDLTQLATASLAARTGEALSVAIGALAALTTVAAIAVIAGRSILKVLPIETVRRIAAGIFAVLAVITLIEAVRA